MRQCAPATVTSLVRPRHGHIRPNDSGVLYNPSQTYDTPLVREFNVKAISHLTIYPERTEDSTLVMIYRLTGPDFFASFIDSFTSIGNAAESSQAIYIVPEAWPILERNDLKRLAMALALSLGGFSILSDIYHSVGGG